MFHYDFGVQKKRGVGKRRKPRRPKGTGRKTKKTTNKTKKRTTTKKKGTSTRKSIYELLYKSQLSSTGNTVGIYRKKMVSVGSLAYKRWKHTTKYKFKHIGQHHLNPTTKLFIKIGLKTKGKPRGPKKTAKKTAAFGFGCGSGGCGGYGRFGREMYPSQYQFGNQGFYTNLGSTMGPYPSALVHTPAAPGKGAFGRRYSYGCNNRFGNKYRY